MPSSRNPTPRVAAQHTTPVTLGRPTNRTKPRTRRRTATGTADIAGTQTLRVVWYRRASTDESNQPYSLDAQEARLRSYTAGHPEWHLVDDYVERASAKDIEGRAELQRLLTDAAAGKFDMVLVARLDRWSRRLVDCLDTVNFLLENEVAFHSASEHFDTSTPTGMLFLQMLGMFAEFERNTIIDRIWRGNDAKVQRGLPLSRRQVPYGMCLDDEGRMAANPDTIGIVRRIFDEYVNAKKGSRTIAADLTEDAIPAPGTKPWSGTAVVRLLRHRGFIGEVRHLDEWHPGAHDPVIDEDLFTAAQKLLDQRAHPAAARSASTDFILTGTITCGTCGGAYVGTGGTSRNGKTHRYYSCVANRRYGAAQCTGPSLPADELEDLVITTMLEVYAEHDLFTQAVQAHLDRAAARTEPLQEQLHTQRTLIATRRGVLDRYQRDYEAGTLSAERYESRANALQEELQALETHAADLETELLAEPPRVPDVAELAGLHDLLRRRLRTGSTASRKGVCNALIESLVVHARDDIAPTFRLLVPEADTHPGSLVAAVEHLAEPGLHPGLALNGSVFAHRDPEWS